VVANVEPLLNFAEAAKALRMGQSSLRAQIAKGRGPIGIKLPGSNRWRFRSSDIAAYLKAGIVPRVVDPPPESPSIIARNKERAAARAAKAREAAAAPKPKPKPKSKPKPKPAPKPKERARAYEFA
jgi:outer membrane biosynthesis protein TonB